MADERRVFKSDPIERLGINHDKFRDNLNILAFTSPATYFEVKKEYLKYLVESIVRRLHGLVYHALTDGKRVDEETGNVKDEYILKDAVRQSDGLVAATMKVDELAPNLPGEVADKIAMDIVLTIKMAFEEDVVNKIFTTAQISNALEKVARKAEMNMDE